MAATGDVTIVCASDANYFGLLRDLVESLGAGRFSAGIPISVLDLGLAPEQTAWLEGRGATVKAPDWDIDFPGREKTPAFFKAMTARPYLPRHFPGHEIYLWIDSDAWVQDDEVLTWFIRGARAGKLAIVPELDRSYWPFYKRPKLYHQTQNHKAFRWCYGFAAADRHARNPILNSGVFALHRDAPHWDLWAAAHRRSLTRRRLWGKGNEVGNLYFRLSEQTALNYVVFADRAPVTLLPALANWFCGKGTPMWDPERRLLVEPNEPHRPLGVVHLAGTNIQERTFDLDTLGDGAPVRTMLTREAILKLL